MHKMEGYSDGLVVLFVKYEFLFGGIRRWASNANWPIKCRKGVTDQSIPEVGRSDKYLYNLNLKVEPCPVF